MSDPVCADCNVPYPYLQKAHIIARHKGGSDDPNNIILVCPNCHHLRDHAERVEWLKKRWGVMTPEERSEQARLRMAALTPEQRAVRSQRISQSKTGKKHPVGHRSGGARVISPEAIARRTEAVRQAWANKTPEERAAHAAKISATKRKKAAH